MITGVTEMMASSPACQCLLRLHLVTNYTHADKLIDFTLTQQKHLWEQISCWITALGETPSELKNQYCNFVKPNLQTPGVSVSADSVLFSKLTAASDWLVFFYILTQLKQSENQCRTSKGCCILIKSVHLQQANANASLNSC